MNENIAAGYLEQIIFGDSEHKQHLLAKKGYGPISSSIEDVADLRRWTSRVVPRLELDHDYNHPVLCYLHEGDEVALIRRTADVGKRRTSVYAHVLIGSASALSPQQAVDAWLWAGWREPDPLIDLRPELSCIDSGGFAAELTRIWERKRD